MARAKPAPPSDSSKPPDSSPAPAVVASSFVAISAGFYKAITSPSNSIKHASGIHHGRQKPARRCGGGDYSPNTNAVLLNAENGMEHRLLNSSVLSHQRTPTDDHKFIKLLQEELWNYVSI